MKENIFKIENIKTIDGNEISFCPERGGIITSIKFQGTEIIYLDETTFEDRKVNVRGGIPILFPNAGAFENMQYPNLKQHGFARNFSNWKFEKNENSFKETLISNNETKELYPYDFSLSIDSEFKSNGSITLSQEVKNLEQDKDLPIAMGLHPYFKVLQDRKGDIRFNFEGGKLIEEQIGSWSNGKSISIDNPKVKDSLAVLEVFIPDLGTLFIDASIEYKKIWIWSLPEKDFICIEPVMRDEGGLVSNPEIVKANETFIASLSISLKKNL